MSLLGKILIILCGVVALVFLCLATIDYGSRQLWGYQAFRRELVLRGLPLDHEEVWNFPSSITAREFGEQTLDDLFRNAGGNPVKTQVQEVETQKQAFLTAIDSLPAARRVARLKDILVALASNGEELDRAFKLTKVEDLRDELEKKFDEVGNDDPRDPDERRRAIAHLLYNLPPLTGTETEWHQRVQVVDGMRAFTREAERQAGDLEQMTVRTKELAADEQSIFRRQYEDMIHHRTTELARQNDFLDNLLKEKEAIKEKHQNLVEGRKTEIEEFVAKVEKANEATKQMLGKQAETEETLFKAQHDLVSVFDENIRLEREIRRIELGR